MINPEEIFGSVFSEVHFSLILSQNVLSISQNKDMEVSKLHIQEQLLQGFFMA